MPEVVLILGTVITCASTWCPQRVRPCLRRPHPLWRIERARESTHGLAHPQRTPRRKQFGEVAGGIREAALVREGGAPGGLLEESLKVARHRVRPSFYGARSMSPAVSSRRMVPASTARGSLRVDYKFWLGRQQG